MSRFQEMIKAPAPSKDFTCPRFNVPLRAVLPGREEVRNADTFAHREYRSEGRDVETKDLIALTADTNYRQSLVREHLIAHCIYADAAPIGLAAVAKLDEATLAYYDRQLAALEDEFDPVPESWREGDVDAFLESVKKNDARIADSLNALPASTLIAWLLITAARLVSSDGGSF